MNKYHFSGQDRQLGVEHRLKNLNAKPFEVLRKQAKIRRLLIEQNNRCSLCGLGGIWNEKKLTLQFDHIDGNSKNEKRENCRMLCPNCHTQTETYCTRNIKGESRERMLIPLKKYRERHKPSDS